MSLSGERMNKLINGCKCLYIPGGVLKCVELIDDDGIYSTSKDSKECCKILGNNKGFPRRLMKNSNDPSKVCGNLRCKKEVSNENHER